MFKITATTASFATLKRLPASATAVVRSYAASAQPPPGEQAKKEAMKDTEDLKWPRASKTDIVDQKLAERLAQEPPDMRFARVTKPQEAVAPRDLESWAAGPTPGYSEKDYVQQTGNTRNQRLLVLGLAFGGALGVSWWINSSAGRPV